MEFVDPHFHVWDVTNNVTGHDEAILGAVAKKFPQYTPAIHSRQLAESPLVVLKAAVHVEAISHHPIAEAKWAFDSSLSSEMGIPQAVVGHIDLSQPHVADQIKEMAAVCPTLRGIRQILNWEPTWPMVKGYLLTEPAFEAGYRQLELKGLSFDLQINPHQMLDAAVLAKKCPGVPVILNHLGCLKLTGTAATDEVALSQWREGMKALAQAGSHVSVKISMLCYIDHDWDNPNSCVPGLVRETLELFGPSRCMFASNYPVDIASAWPAARLMRGFQALCHHLSAEAQAQLFSGTARRVYKLPLPQHSSGSTHKGNESS